MGLRRTRRLAVLLGLWIAAGAIANALWANPDPPAVARYEAWAAALPEGPVGFVSDRPARASGYRLSALRYALAPQEVRDERAGARSRWLVADRRGRPAPPPGYERVRRLDAETWLLARRDRGRRTGP